MLTTTAPAISGYKVENLNDATYFSLGTGDGSAAGYMMGMVVISGANSSGVKLVQIQTVTSATATGYPIIEQGVYTGSSVVSSVSLISSAGTFDGGTMYIYGAA